ncbi:MAG: ImmA/IrrE family metallo-endopeptidase [Planctomycetes bacterium]|nr:ImmA/IrrE family metallo-endopeptidase [Planctomycetota bacterium]
MKKPGSWDFAINEDALDEHAGDVVASLVGKPTGPVPLLEIAKTEGIVVRRDDFGGLFDGRLEYEPRTGFVLYVNEQGRSSARQRFSVGHELGHYYRHRESFLAGGGTHNSKVDFVRDRQEEREADYFASALLMPKALVQPLLNRGPPELRQALQIAEQFEASVTSAVLRVVRLSHFPCAVVVSTAGRVEFAWRSPILYEARIGYLEKGLPIGKSTLTGRVGGKVGIEPQSEDCRLSTWFDHDLEEDPELLEEVVDLGPRTLTFLSLEEDALEELEDDETEDEDDE